MKSGKIRDFLHRDSTSKRLTISSRVCVVCSMHRYCEDYRLKNDKIAVSKFRS